MGHKIQHRRRTLTNNRKNWNRLKKCRRVKMNMTIIWHRRTVPPVVTRNHRTVPAPVHLLMRVNSWSVPILFLACWQLRVVKQFCTETWPGVTVTAQVSFSIFLGKSEPNSRKSSHLILSRNFLNTWASISIPAVNYVTGWWTEEFTLLSLVEGSEPRMLLISELIFSVTLTLAVEVECCWILVDVTLSMLVWGVSGILVAGCLVW